MAEDRELKAMETTLDALKVLEDPERERVLVWLAAKLGVELFGRGRDVGGRSFAANEFGTTGTIKDFLRIKKPGDDVARATVLAYFLIHAKSESTFKTADITRGRLDAALATFNTSRAISHAVRAGYITSGAKRGTYQITSTGEALVDAMPDQEAMRAVRLQVTRPRRKASSPRRDRARVGEVAGA